MNVIQNEEAEVGVLGSCLVPASMVTGDMPIDIALDKGCEEGWFYTPANRRLWSVLVQMHTSGEAIDLLTIGSTLKKDGALESIGGYEYIEKVMDATPTHAHIESYLKVACDTYKRRRVSEIGMDTIEKAGREDCEPEKLIADMSAELTSLTSSKGVVSMGQIREDNLSVINDSFDGKVTGVPLPWERFSNHINGVQRGSVCPLIGRDGKGKSGAAAQILHHWAEVGVPCLSFSMEDVARRTVLRMAGCGKWFSARGFDSAKTLLGGTWQKMAHCEKQQHEQKWEAYMDWLEKRPFWIDDNKYTVEQVCSKIRHHKRVHKIEAVIIDGFKDIIHSKGESETAAEKHIAQELFRVAKEEDVAMIVVSHITKIDDGVPIKKENLKGSGTQFQGARQVLIFQDAGLQDTNEEEGLFVLSCTKNNYGSGGSVVLQRDTAVLSYAEK